ncbi:FtsX-like permease family protein [Halopseudomonas phragmitis]|uniref:ABC transporter permease n=1 Tax=Halopseudomonas phragmitis TaxID=1931241 RepID=A0A1V0B3L3_9GAMM|nr:FtsX-like permease family protein [Halopseudomonas phragmitis]AQZ94480.1 ABC transporter permease [Halopseudomonas phragmitis]
MLGRLGWTWLTLLSHWRRHPLQALCLLVGLWLATALWSGVQALNAQARDSYERAAQLFGDGQQTVLINPAGQMLAEADYIDLRLAGWPVSPLLRGSLRFEGPDGPRRLQVLGVEPLTLPAGGLLGRQLNSASDLSDFMYAPGRTWLATDTLAELGWQPGQQPQTEHGARLPSLQVRDELPSGTLVVDIGQAQALLERPGQLSQLLVEQGFAADRPALPAGIELVWDQREEADLERLSDSFHMNLSALGLLAFLVGLFIVHAAAGLALEQRRGLLQTLRACGVSLSQLSTALILELLVLALLAGLLGLVSGYLIASLLVGDVAASLRGLYGAQVVGQLRLEPGWWWAGLGMAVLGCALAGAASVLRALRLPVLAWARPQAWREAQGRTLRRLSLAAVVLLGAALLLVWRGDSLVSGFMLLGCLLLGVAWLLPLWLALLLRLGQRLAKQPVWQWFWADSQQQLGGLSLALMALLLALAANIGVGSMTEGFRKTFVGWLDQRLAADIYVRPDGATEAVQLSRWLQARPEVVGLLPSWQQELRVGGWPTEASGVINHPLYAESWPLRDSLAQAWPRLHAGEGVMVSEQLAQRLGLTLGSNLELLTPAGVQVFVVLGHYADYGNPRGQVLMAAERFRELWPQRELTSIGVLTREGAAAQLVEALRHEFDLPGNRVIDQATLKDYSRQVFEQTFAATAALNSLTLGVAVIALLCSLLSLADSRLGQLAPLWAMGLTPAGLARLSLIQMLALAGLTCLLAIPLGLALAWVLVEVVNVQAFGWRLPWHWFPGQWLVLTALALLAVLLASLGPVWRLSRQGPMDMLRRLAHD